MVTDIQVKRQIRLVMQELWLLVPSSLTLKAKITLYFRALQCGKNNSSSFNCESSSISL